MYKIYSFLLAAIIGCELTLGIVVAPTLFNGGEILADSLPEYGHFEGGLLMGQIFYKFNYALFCVSVVSILFELVGLFDKNISFNVRFSRFCLSLIVVFCAGLFVFYFTDFILEAQSIQETKTQEFQSIHDASEYVFKIILIAQSVLFFLPKVKSKG